MAGRRPRPTRLKLLEGTARKDRERENEPVPPEGEIIRPDYLKYREKELWDEYAPALISMGTLTVVDVPNFATWCVLEAEFENVKSKMNAALVAQMRLYGADFGIGAGARAKLGTKKVTKKNPEEKYFNNAV